MNTIPSTPIACSEDSPILFMEEGLLDEGVPLVQQDFKDFLQEAHAAEGEGTSLIEEVTQFLQDEAFGMVLAEAVEDKPLEEASETLAFFQSPVVIQMLEKNWEIGCSEISNDLTVLENTVPMSQEQSTVGSAVRPLALGQTIEHGSAVLVPEHTIPSAEKIGAEVLQGQEVHPSLEVELTEAREPLTDPLPLEVFENKRIHENHLPSGNASADKPLQAELMSTFEQSLKFLESAPSQDVLAENSNFQEDLGSDSPMPTPLANVAPEIKSPEGMNASIPTPMQTNPILYDLKPSLLQHLSYLEAHQPASLKVSLKLDPQGEKAVDMQVKLTSTGKLQVNFEHMPSDLQEFMQSTWSELQPTMIAKGWSLDGPHFEGSAANGIEPQNAPSGEVKNFLKNFLQSPLAKGIVPKALARFRSGRGPMEKSEPTF